MQLDSLQTRAMLFVVFITAITLPIGWFSHLYLNHVDRDGIERFNRRDSMMNLNREAKNAIWELKTQLDTFLLQADDKDRNFLENNFRNIEQILVRLSNMPALDDVPHRKILRHAIDEFDYLRLVIEHLMEVRTVAYDQYPALAYMRDLMEPSNITIATLGGILEEELDVTDPTQREFHNIVSKIRFQWMKMLSSFRLFLIVRFGAVRDPLIEGRRENISVFSETIYDDIVELDKMEQQYPDMFMTGSISPTLFEVLSNWKQGLEKVLEIADSGKWRADMQLLDRKIEPAFSSIWMSLDELDTRLEDSSRDSFDRLHKVASELTYIIWSIISILLSSLLLGYFYFRKTVLLPLKNISLALERDDVTTLNHMQGDVAETRQLLHAYVKMQREVVQRQKELAYQTDHDDLTKLPNRYYLKRQIQELIEENRDDSLFFAVIIKDLNRFKEINDTLGHNAGDEILKQVAERLVMCVRDTDLVTRIGGDEFALLLRVKNERDVDIVLEKINGAMSPVFHYFQQELYISSSMGVARYPIDTQNADQLLQFADVAMYSAKRNNKNYAYYDPNDDENSMRNLELVRDLRTAIQQNRLMLYYQPKQNMATDKICGVEALIRWNHPERGMVAPDFLVQLAEKSGMIEMLTMWVVATALRQLKIWQDQGYEMSMSVNLSAWNLQDTNIKESCSRVMSETNWNGKNLIFEITEGAMMNDPNRVLINLQMLKQMGIEISIDDYGTGFSSLSYLKRFPVNELKIDQSFVKDMCNNEHDRTIVASTIELAHNLDLRVVAEGVEDKETGYLLRQLGCDVIQGYDLSRPLPIDEFNRWLQSHPHD